jgi:16S rRNA processing protein RimM
MQNNYSDGELIPIGRVVGAFGIKGWVKIKVDTNEPNALSKYSSIYVSINGMYIKYKLEEFFVTNNIFHAKFSEVSNRELAMQLRGCNVAVLRSEFPNTVTGEYYWVDLIGLEVYNKANVWLGQVVDLMETGANSVLVVKNQSADKHLIPFVAVYILEVDLEAKKITVDWELDY